MRMIDGDALIKRLDYCVSQGLGGNIAFMFGHMVDEAPTVDAVPVIRCKDCKWNTEHYDDNSCVTYWVCNNWGCHTDSDGYCYEAERKEE